MENWDLYNMSENLVERAGEYVVKFLAERNITEIEIPSKEEFGLHNLLYTYPRSNYKEPFDVFRKISKIGVNLRINRVMNFRHDINIYDDENECHRLRHLCPEDIIHVVECIEDIKMGEVVSKRTKPTGKILHFENEDIIITDPCYIINHDNDRDIPYEVAPYKWEDYDLVKQNGWIKGEMNIRQSYAAYMKKKEYDELVEKWKKDHELEGYSSDWAKCDWGNNMEVLGITKYLVRDTIYGDWSCTTFNSDNKEPIGEFCADAGMVGVFSLKEILAYNPKFDYHLTKKWTTTLIKNFTGDVWDEVEEVKYKDDDGEEMTDYEVHIVGKGNVNFITKQTGA